MAHGCLTRRGGQRWSDGGIVAGPAADGNGFPRPPESSRGFPVTLSSTLASSNMRSREMVRRTLCVAAILALLVGVALAADEGTKATVKKVDAENNKITLMVGDDEKTYDVSKDAEIYTQGRGKKNKPAPKDALAGGLKNVKDNTAVIFVTVKSGGKEVIVSMKIEGMTKKK